MWDFQESVGSIKTPRYLNFSDLSKSRPLDDMENDLEASLWWLPASIILDLVELSISTKPLSNTI